MTNFEKWKNDLTAQSYRKILETMCLDVSMEVCPAREYCDSRGGCCTTAGCQCEARYYEWAGATASEKYPKA
jgi:hypothetical protein